MTTIAFVDCETIGLDIDLHAVWEVGLILRGSKKLDDGTTVVEDAEYSWLLPVENLAFADPFALKLCGFHDRHPSGLANIDKSDGRVGQIEAGKIDSLEKFSRQFAALTRGAHWAGMVPSFDEERVRRIVRSVGLTHEWHYHLIEIESLVAGWVKGKYGTKDEAERKALELPWDSKELSACVGINSDDYERHTALGDCRWGRDLYDVVTG